MNDPTGAEITIRLLERQRVRVVAGIPGGAVLPIYDALSRSTRIRHVLARHEQGAGFIAHGVARVTGEPGVCLASSGPGATNLLTALADAKLDSIPLVAITGQVPRALIGTDAFQEVDTCALARPVTKACFRVDAAGELVDALPRAFEIASTGRPGPVLVDVPKDVQTERARVDAWPAPGGRAAPPPVDPAALDAAARLIDAAERPVLYLGGGVIHSGAAAAAIALAERCTLPTVTTLMALSAMPAGHALLLGMLGMHGARHTNLALDECDLLIALGARFDDRATGRIAAFCPQAKVVHVDIDRGEIGKLKRADVGIEGDVADALSGLAARTRARDRPGWRARIDALQRAHAPPPCPGDPRAPAAVIATLAAGLGGDAIVTTDVGQHQMWVAQWFPFARPRALLTSGGLGTMGFGLPAAIGAALAAPRRTVACISGDGSILMNLQELVTLAELDLDVKVVVLDNAALGLVHQQQTLFYARRSFAARFERPPDLVGIATALGIDALDLDAATPDDARLGALLTRPGPALIRVRIGVEQQVLPMVPPGAANTDMIVGAAAADALPQG